MVSQKKKQSMQHINVDQLHKKKKMFLSNQGSLKDICFV